MIPRFLLLGVGNARAAPRGRVAEMQPEADSRGHTMATEFFGRHETTTAKHRVVQQQRRLGRSVLVLCSPALLHGSPVVSRLARQTVGGRGDVLQHHTAISQGSGSFCRHHVMPSGNTHALAY